MSRPRTSLRWLLAVALLVSVLTAAFFCQQPTVIDTSPFSQVIPVVDAVQSVKNEHGQTTGTLYRSSVWKEVGDASVVQRNRMQMLLKHARNPAVRFYWVFWRSVRSRATAWWCSRTRRVKCWAAHGSLLGLAVPLSSIFVDSTLGGWDNAVTDQLIEKLGKDFRRFPRCPNLGLAGFCH